MDDLVAQLIIGITAGAEVAVIAAGLALLFGVLEIVNFAHGELYMLGAYMLYVGEAGLGLPYGAAAAFGLISMAVFGCVFYYLVIRRVLNRGWQIQIVGTVAASILMVNLAIVMAGGLPKAIPSGGFSFSFVEFGPNRISVQRFVILGLALVAFMVLGWFLTRTKMGTAMRAVAQNREAAAVVGIPISTVGLIATVVASVLAGVAAVTVTPLYQADPTMGMMMSLKAFVAVIVGGFGSVKGAIVAAFAVGIVESFAVRAIGGGYAAAIVFGMMIVVLLLRPQGIFGKGVRA